MAARKSLRAEKAGSSDGDQGQWLFGDRSDDQWREFDVALKELFQAIDLDDSGEITRDEFLQMEMRADMDGGKLLSAGAMNAKVTKIDGDMSGTISFDEFRERQLEDLCGQDIPKEEAILYLRQLTRNYHILRVQMGVRYNAEIRNLLRDIFSLFDVSGDGQLSLDEWIAAQKCVALEISDDPDEEWMDQAAFGIADKDGDGQLSVDEFLDQSFDMLESTRKTADEHVRSLARIKQLLICKQPQLKQTKQLKIMVQTKQNPDFRPPRLAWQDEPTFGGDEQKNSGAWHTPATVQLPLCLETIEEIIGALKLVLQLPEDTWLSVFFKGPPNSEGHSPVTLLRQGNIQRALEYLAKPRACERLYVKNRRKIPSKLTHQGKAFLEEKESLMAKLTGTSYALDWETQLMVEGVKKPWPLELVRGDAFVVEVPVTDDYQKFRYVCTVFMDGTTVLSHPIDQTVAGKTKSKKRRSSTGSQGVLVDELQQLSFVALTEGKCTLFVEVSWEDQEEKLTHQHKLVAPVAENTIARLGPLEVNVVKAAKDAKAQNQKKDAKAQTQNQPSIVWWNGQKWVNKKPTAKIKA